MTENEKILEIIQNYLERSANDSFYEDKVFIIDFYNLVKIKIKNNKFGLAHYSPMTQTDITFSSLENLLKPFKITHSVRLSSKLKKELDGENDIM